MLAKPTRRGMGFSKSKRGCPMEGSGSLNKRAEDRQAED